jgi:DNA-binding transcriptional MerR regulator/methylmalonyl-CoA mutase cobalamin-binding subunit
MARHGATGASATNAGASSSTSYSIRVVSSQTGIPAETLRVWERRYGFPKPARRSGGGRLYGEQDVARLHLIARAREAGYRPGDVIALSDREILRLVEDKAAARPTDQRSFVAPSVDQLVADIRANEVTRVRATLRSLAITLGPKVFVTDVAHPLAVAIGCAWEQGTIDVHQEHLASALVSMQLRLLLSAFEDGEGAPVVVLATLPGEAHALGLEMVAVYLAAHRATPRLLGADTPADQIARAARAMDADVIGISVSLAHESAVARPHVDALRRALADLGDTELWIGGGGAPGVIDEAPGDRVRVAMTWADVDGALAAFRAG